MGWVWCRVAVDCVARSAQGQPYLGQCPEIGVGYVDAGLESLPRFRRITSAAMGSASRVECEKTAVPF
jgi:hypothetical protein